MADVLAQIDALQRQQALPIARPSMSFAMLLETLHRSRFSGRVMIDLSEGHPTAFEIPTHPIQVKVSG